MSLERVSVAVLCATLIAGAAPAARPRILPIPERIAASDFVGLVEVKSTWPSSRNDFRQVADAEVIETLKGDDASWHVAIRFDTGPGCPNVIFERDGVYLVFLSEGPDGSYTSVSPTRYAVVDGQIDHWNGRGLVALDEIKGEIARWLAE